MGHFKDRALFGLRGTIKRFVQTFSAQASDLGDIFYPMLFKQMTQGTNKRIRIIIAAPSQ